MSSTLLVPRLSPLRRVAGRVLRSPAGRVLDTLAARTGSTATSSWWTPSRARDTERAVVTSVRRETADVTTLTVKADPDGRVSPHLVHEARPGLVVGLSAAEGEFTLPPTRRNASS